MRVPWPVTQISVRRNDIYQSLLSVLCSSEASISLGLHHNLIVPRQTQALHLIPELTDMVTPGNYFDRDSVNTGDPVTHRPAHVISVHTKDHELVLDLGRVYFR